MGAKRNSINEEMFERIIVDYLFGKEPRQIAQYMDISKDTARRIVLAYEIVKGEDWNAALAYVKNGYRLKYLEWATRRKGITLPQEVVKAYDEFLASRNTAEPKEPEQIEIDTNPCVLEPNGNDGLYLVKVLQALNKTNELLEQLMDVVIPKYVVDMKDNQNANADIISERVKKCEERLEKVAVNTRKRGQ